MSLKTVSTAIWYAWKKKHTKEQFIKEKNFDVPKHINDTGFLTSHETELENKVSNQAVICEIKGDNFELDNSFFLQIMYHSKLFVNFEV